MTFAQLKRIGAKAGITLWASGRFANVRYHMKCLDGVVVTYHKSEIADLEHALNTIIAGK